MSKRRDKHSKSEEDEAKMTKIEEEVAKYIRFNCPTSTTLFEGNEVHYFSGNKLVDTLWDSKYGSKSKKDPMFKTRDECFLYIADLYSKQLFFRAKKLVPKKKEDKEKAIESSADAPKSPKSGVEKRKDKKSKEVKEEEPVTETEAEDDKKKDEKKEKDGDKDEKKKKKVKLLLHPTQVFIDDKDVYVWVFDPTPLYKKIIGCLMLVGTIVGCLFPLWPMWLRQGVYYLSICGISVFGLIIVVAILRSILFGIIYAVTMGRHKLWVFPNLTEDCGVLESFQPFYTYEYCPGDSSDSSDKKDKKKKDSKKKDKNSDDEKEKDDEKTPLVEKSKDDVEDDDEDAEKYSQASTDDNYEKVDGEEVSEEVSGEEDEDASSVPPSPEEGVRKRRPAKV